MTSSRNSLTLVFIALLMGFSATPAPAIEPDEVGGLVAWYRADSLQLKTGDKVGDWPDDSGNGHDLVDDGNGLFATYDAVVANNKPAVMVRKGNSHSVIDPFELGDHTIFVVFRNRLAGRALLRSDGSEFVGVLLRAGNLHDQLALTGGQKVVYGSLGQPDRRFGITVLGREAGTLYDFVNGVDLATGEAFEGTLRVGKFFHLAFSRYAKADGDGLSVAEMIFYNRFLGDEERAEVTRYLSAKYAIELGADLPESGSPGAGETFVIEAPAIVQLSTATKANVNEAMVAVPWDRQDELDAPFEHDSATNNTRLVCTEDDLRVRLYTSLPLSAEVDGVNVRVLFRVNGALFLRGEGRSGPFGGAAGKGKASVSAAVITTLNSGDYVEVVVLKAGAAGTVTIDPDEAVFIVEEK